MKVLIATTNFPRWLGDIRAPFIYELAIELSGKGNDVCIVTMQNPGGAPHEDMNGLDVYRIQYYNKPDDLLQKDTAGLPAAWGRGWNERKRFIPYTLKFSKAIADLAHGYDIVHANWSLAGIATLMSKTNHHLPYVVTIHGSDIFKTKNIPLVSSAVGLALRKASKVIAVSNELGRVAQGFGVNRDNIDILSNGVNLKNFPIGSFSNRKKIILFVGSLIIRKGLIYLLQAMAQIQKLDPEVKLLLVGEGDQKDVLTDFVNQNGLAKSVEFLGLQSQESISNLMREARVFVLPSIEEGQGGVLLEALASGTPCVGSRVGGIPDVITDDVGELVEPTNVEGFVIAIKKFLENDDVWEHCSRNARARAVENFDWNKIADRVLEIYKMTLMERN